MATTYAYPDEPFSRDHQHPTDTLYVRVAIVLAIITIVEVVIYYIPALAGIIVPALIILSLAKFVAVVSYFMHLKFDDKRFAWMFTAGIIISISVMSAIAVMQHTGGYYAPILPPPTA